MESIAVQSEYGLVRTEVCKVDFHVSIQLIFFKHRGIASERFFLTKQNVVCNHFDIRQQT
jgi:hypothetical protein